MKYLAWLLVLLMAFASIATADELPPAAADESADLADNPGIDEPAKAEDPAPAETKSPSKSKRKKAKAAATSEAEEPVMAGKPSDTPKEIPVRETPAPTPAAQPAPASRFSLGTHLAYWNAKDLEDFDYGGFIGVGIIGQYQLNPRLALEGRMGALASGASEDTFVESAGWFENTLTLVALPIEAGIVGFLPIDDRFTAYAGGGVGFYLFDGEFTSEQGRWKQTYDMSIDPEVGFYGVLGLRWQLARNLSLYAEAKYTVVEASLEDDLAALVASERTGALPFEQDVDLGGIGIQAGAIFTF
jgi:opacity protein-like surface antigen